ncbi:hypothetical protein HD806DRAFT_552104 [Xylariaceae sp. AK1471]|nr:hypothetical protein HD806DRAFT_552104 [Xylariaceae sp. AK1471]
MDGTARSLLGDVKEDIVSILDLLSWRIGVPHLLVAIIFTTNYAIPYTISNLWRQKEDKSKENLGSLAYLNNELMDCNVTEVTIQVLGKYNQNPINRARSRVGLLVNTYATCAVDIDTSHLHSDPTSGLTYVDLVGSYNILDDNISRFLLRNTTEKASLYWGESLLYLYYLVTAKAYYDGASGFPWGMNGTDANTYNVFIQLRRQSNAMNGSAEEVMSDEFFDVHCYTEASFCDKHTIPWLSQGKGVDGHEFNPYANIWNTVDFLGKAMCRNLTNEVQFREALQAKDDGTLGSTLMIDNALETTSFNTSTIPQPLLGAQSSFLSTNYICQVPRLKPLASRFFSILIVDIVLLQTVWQYCEGCFESHIQQSAEPGRDPSTGTLKTRKPDVSWKSPNETTVELTNYTQLNQTEGHGN